MENDYRINEHILDINHEKNKILAERLVSNSVGSDAMVVAPKNKEIPRRDLLKYTVFGLGVAATALYFNEKLGISAKVSNELDLRAANSYMIDTKFKEYFERLNMPYETEEFLMFKKLNINDDNIMVMQALLECLQEDGFSETESWFAISQAFGNDGLYLIAKIYGKDSIDDLLMSKGYLYTREDGSHAPYREYFSNQNQVGYIENVKILKDLEEKKGMGL